MNRWTIAAFLLLEALPASAQGSKAEADRAALLKTDTEWARHAAMGKDVERIISFWTDDAVIYPPREPPIVGKAASAEVGRAGLFRRLLLRACEGPFLMIPLRDRP